MDVLFLSFAILGYAVMGVVMFIMFWLDRDGLLNAIQVRFRKGMVYAFIIGQDNRIYQYVTQFAGKSSDTITTEISGMPYVMNKKKLFQYNRQPALLYEEGISEPLTVSSGQMESTNLTPELFKQAIIVARQSGKMPNPFDQQKLTFYLLLICASASVVGAYFGFKLTGQTDKMFAMLVQLGDGMGKLVGTLIK